MKAAEEVRQELITRTKEALKLLENGCADGSCELVEPGSGMRTNGGCHCWRNLQDIFAAGQRTISEVRKPGTNRRCWRYV